MYTEDVDGKLQNFREEEPLTDQALIQPASQPDDRLCTTNHRRRRECQLRNCRGGLKSEPRIARITRMGRTEFLSLPTALMACGPFAHFAAQIDFGCGLPRCVREFITGTDRDHHHMIVGQVTAPSCLRKRDVNGTQNLLGGRDSNPDKQIQSLRSYRWTTSQTETIES